MSDSNSAVITQLGLTCKKPIELGAQTTIKDKTIEVDIHHGQITETLILTLDENPASQDAWAEGTVVGKEKIEVPANCWTPDIVETAARRWWLTEHPGQHVHVQDFTDWKLPATPQEKFLAEKRASSETRRLLG